MPKSDFAIDESSYQEGRAAFSCGASIRSIVEQVQVSITSGSFDEDKVLSSAIGFVDALLDQLRQRPVVTMAGPDARLAGVSIDGSMIAAGVITSDAGPI